MMNGKKAAKFSTHNLASEMYYGVWFLDFYFAPGSQTLTPAPDVNPDLKNLVDSYF